ncbi:hypothetical protein I302_107083 [Kwoniella bestiolae CBS 10118]|uniref:Uncharacterized protein n=1 Tax=Kwoniella bestiolae CBS 10118 TaxID=1296100 RepID=A0A1B9FZK2_9TREE|nr:hypothetical protein I302_05652 [Kwoniella bestiolae CBS 10118]OCF24193.1 hypothetical protein I302_05652 [Kwoniella bestiolae CBS 10118]
MPPRTLFSLSLSLPRLTFQPLALHQRIRPIMTFPHPTLEDPSTGSTKLIIKTFNRNIPSLPHLYTILRSIEHKLNLEIYDFSVLKDADSLSPLNTIFLTSLKPIHLESPVLMEIPLRRISGESNFLGGPSLGDIQAALNNLPQQSVSEPPSSDGRITNKNKSSTKGEGEETIQIKIEIQRNPLSAKSQRKPRNPNKRVRHPAAGREASEIVKQLKAFNGGFYGGFEGLAERFEHLIIEPKDQTQGQIRKGQGQEGEQSEEAAVDVQQVKEGLKSEKI